MSTMPAAAATSGSLVGTPTADDVRVLAQRIEQMHQEMTQLRRELPTATPQQRQQVHLRMVELMGEMGQFMDLMDQAIGQMSPEERRAVEDTLARMQADIDEMERTMVATSPGPGPLGTPGTGPMMRPGTPGTGPGAGPMGPPGTPGVGPAGPGMGQMSRQMDRMHRDLATQERIRDPQVMADMMEDMADLTGNMDQLMDHMGPAFDEMTPEERQRLLRQADEMHETVQEMRRLSGAGSGTPMPTASAVP